MLLSLFLWPTLVNITAEYNSRIPSYESRYVFIGSCVSHQIPGVNFSEVCFVNIDNFLM